MKEHFCFNRACRAPLEIWQGAMAGNSEPLYYCVNAACHRYGMLTPAFVGRADSPEGCPTIAVKWVNPPDESGKTESE